MKCIFSSGYKIFATYLCLSLFGVDVVGMDMDSRKKNQATISATIVYTSGPRLNVLSAAQNGNETALQEALQELSQNDTIDYSDVEGRTALHHAVFHGRTDMIIRLLTHRANINAVDMMNQTPLHYAALYANLITAERIVETLLAEGARFSFITGYQLIQTLRAMGRRSRIIALLVQRARAAGELIFPQPEEVAMVAATRGGSCNPRSFNPSTSPTKTY